MATLTASEYEKLNNKVNEVIRQGFTPSKEDLAVKKRLVKYIVDDYIRPAAPDDIIHVYHTGSAYEKTIVGDDLDFDCFLHVKIPASSTWRAEPAHPGWSYLTGGPPDAQHVTGNGRLSSLKVRQYIKGKIDNKLTKVQSLSFGGEKVIMTRSEKGPAITMNVKLGNRKPFTLDLVVSVRSDDISSNTGDADFVAKPFDKTKPLEHNEMWRNSYSKREKDKLDTLDDGNKCHRAMLKILKTLRKHSAQFRQVPSYCYKNLILNLSENGNDWSKDQMAHRFIEVIKALRDAFDNADLRVHFNKTVNLLEGDKNKYRELKNMLQKCINRGFGGYLKILDLIPQQDGASGLVEQTQGLSIR